MRDLHAYYGKSHILHGVDLDVGAGEIVSCSGATASGRSTTVKAIMGEVPPTARSASRGDEIAGLPSYRIAHLGLGYVPENRDIFPAADRARRTCMLGLKDPRRRGTLDD